MKRIFLGLLLVLLICEASHLIPSHRLENSAEKRAENLHYLDTLILLTYITVMVVIVLTAWLFKHYRFRFIHESGLTLFYGVLIGFVIRYFNIGQFTSQTYDVALPNGSRVTEPPDYLRLEVQSEDKKKVSFHYELIEGFFADDKKQNEQIIQQKSAFSPEIFFNILLPPIIFNAGYCLKKRHFFRNIGSILGFVFVGTTFSCLATGFLMLIFTKIFGMGFSFKELLFFGALISATDPVTVISIFTELNVESDLFALVFGESALNDAVAIVLASTIDQFSMSSDVIDIWDFAAAVYKFFSVFFGSLLLGSFIGCMNALLTKMTKIADYPLLESSLFVLISYESFLLAELLGYTGIVSVLFCGIAQAHYTFNNLSNDSQHTTKQFFQMISFVLESFIFCYIGVSVFVSNSQKWHFGFIIFALFSIVVARAGFVYPLCSLINLRRVPPIPRRYQHMIVFSGLRGAMAFAIAARNTATENRQIIYATTAAIVMVTVFLNGGLTTWMVDYLGILRDKSGRMLTRNEIKYDILFSHGSSVVEQNSRQLNECSALSLPSTRDSTDASSPISIPLTPSGANPWDKAFLPRKWYNFDATFMKPLLTHATPSLEQTLPPCCYPISRIFTSDKQRAVSSELDISSSSD